MAKKFKISLLILSLLTGLMITGCKLDYQRLWQKTQPVEPELLNVEIHFDNKDVVYGYVKNMGIEADGEVYNGGSSISYIYNKQGKITGSFNYARVEFMKLVP